jgi:hypothetical protein
MLSLDDGASVVVPGLWSNAGAWRLTSSRLASRTRAAWLCRKILSSQLVSGLNAGRLNELLDLLANDLRVQPARFDVDATNRLEKVPLCIKFEPRLAGEWRGRTSRRPYRT